MMNEYTMVLAENIKDCSLDYEGLNTEVRSLMKMHGNLEMQISAMKGPLNKAYYSVKNFLFGKPKYSVEEIMNLQLGVIRQVRRGLESQANKTRNKLGTMVNYTETIGNRIEDNLQYKETEKPLLENIAKGIEQKKIELQTADKTKPGYFKEESAVKRNVRDYKERMHKYDLAIESASDLLNQRAYFGLQEEIIRNTVHTSERLVEKTKRIENQISIMKGIYDSVLKQHKLYAALYHALECQRTYISNLDQILIAGQQTMQSIADRSSMMKQFNDVSTLEGTVENLEAATKDRLEDREYLLADSLNK